MSQSDMVMEESLQYLSETSPREEMNYKQMTRMKNQTLDSQTNNNNHPDDQNVPGDHQLIYKITLQTEGGKNVVLV
jgi:hypothetical protein